MKKYSPLAARALIGFLVLVAACQSVIAQSLPTTKTIQVEIRDAILDTPIAGSPVLLRENQIVVTTNAQGIARFTQIPLSQSTATIWTSPANYAPGIRTIDDLKLQNSMIVQVTPAHQYTTDLIPAVTGGSFSFSGLAHPDSPREFVLSLEVPPNALPEDATISVSPYANWLNSQPGKLNSHMALGMLYFWICDSAGDPIRGNFSVPITVKMRPWALEDIPNEVDSIDPSKLVYYRYNLQSGGFEVEPVQSYIDLANDLICFDIDRFSMHMMCIDETEGLDWLFSDDDNPPAKPYGVLTVHKSAECDLDCSRNVTCGFPDSDCEWGVTKGTSFEIGAELESKLTAQFEAEYKNILIGKIEASAGIEISTTLSGKYGGTTTKDMKGKVNQGVSVTGPKQCVSGEFYGYTVYDKFTIYIAGHNQGSIKFPTGTATERVLDFDSTCPNCADVISYTIEDPNPCGDD